MYSAILIKGMDAKRRNLDNSTGTCIPKINVNSWMTVLTPTDRPKSVRNSCVIKVFGGVFMFSRCFLDCSVGVGVFVTGLSQISSFFYCHGDKKEIMIYTFM